VVDREETCDFRSPDEDYLAPWDEMEKENDYALVELKKASNMAYSQNKENPERMTRENNYIKAKRGAQGYIEVKSREEIIKEYIRISRSKKSKMDIKKKKEEIPSKLKGVKWLVKSEDNDIEYIVEERENVYEWACNMDRELKSCENNVKIITLFEK
jgi:hypothetical protein